MKIRIGLSSDVLDAIERLPKAQRNKVRRFILEFQKNPTATGYNFEKIANAADDRMRSVRIDQTYRAIILKPEKGNTYLLVWVDHHDDAYDWAQRKQIAINPETGGIQVFAATTVESKASQKDPTERKAMFDSLRDRELIRIGVPGQQLDLVRSFLTQTDVFDNEDVLPKEAFESLFYLSEGERYDDVVRSLDRTIEEQNFDTEDFVAALDRPESKRQFVVADDALLEEMLNAPLEKWRVFLHPSQRRLVRMNANGPVRVLGGAGTGKTVVAMHRANRLSAEVFTDKDDRILFTTFTRNLAADISSNLRFLCDDATYSRIEVTNFDQWVANFLRSAGVDYQMAYGQLVHDAWDAVLAEVPTDDFPSTFYKDEFYSVVLQNGIQTRAEYLSVPRVGRGNPLNRRGRARVWPMFEMYREELRSKGFKEPQDAFLHARHLLKDSKQRLPYRAIVLDEAQDMSAEAMRLIRAMVPEGPQDLFIVGDAHQRIYGRPIVLSHCGINIVGRGRRLRVNYRTTEEVRDWAVGILEGVAIDDLDGARDSMLGFRSLVHGAEPVVKSSATFADEVSGIIDHIQSLTKDQDDQRQICLVARTNRLRDQYYGALESHGIEMYQLKRSQAEDRSQAGVRIATMHRVKGLEFDHVIVAGVNDGIVPLSNALAASEDEHEISDALLKERALLYVAATRAKKTLLVTSFGKQSEFLGEPSFH